MADEGEARYDLFIVHAAADRAWVDGYLKHALSAEPARLITPRDFQLGAPIPAEFDRAVATSRYTALVLSPAFLADRWTEFGEQLVSFTSVEEGRGRVVAVTLHPCEPPPRLRFRVGLDCTDWTQWDEQAARLRDLLGRPEPTPEVIPCPYPGMVPFRPEDARFFFGREAEIQGLLTKLRAHRFLLVIGSSGSGKSSLVLAGLLPKLADPNVFSPGTWKTVTLRPGATPLKDLAARLGGDPDPPEAVVTALLAASPPAQRLLLYVDQLEEVYSLVKDRAEQDRFFSRLKALRADARCVVLGTMRADFYSDLMNSALWPVDDAQQVKIAAPRGDALRTAIVAPAEKVGVCLEDSLVERLLADAADEPGTLPMLQEALVLLWGKRSWRLITRRSYVVLGQDSRSGLAVAMATRADATLADLPPQQQLLARRIFLRLVQFGEGRPDTRRQLPVEELHSEADDPQVFDHVLSTLIDHRLLTPSLDDRLGRRVDIAHEMLIIGWPASREWVRSRRDAELTRRRLEGKAEEWVRLGRGEGSLLSAVELAEADDWLKCSDAVELGIDKEVRDLVNMSHQAIRRVEHEREAARQREIDLANEQATRARELAAARERERDQALKISEERNRRVRELKRFLAALGGLAALLVVAVLIARSAKTDAQNQSVKAQDRLARNYWQEARAVRASDPLLSLHLMTQAAVSAVDPRLRTAIALDHLQALSSTRLIASWDVARFDGPAGVARFDVALAEGGRSAVVWAEGRVTRLSLSADNPAERELVAPGKYTSAWFNRAGTALLLWSPGGDAEILDTATGRITGPPLKAGKDTRFATFGAGDTALATADPFGRVRVWNAVNGAPTGESPKTEGFERLVLSPDGSRGLTVCRRKEYIYDTTYTVTTLWDFHDRRALSEYGAKDDPRPAVGRDGVFSRDGRSLLTWDGPSAWLVDARDGTTRRSVLDHRKEAVAGAVFARDGSRVVTWTNFSVIRVWDPAAPGEPLRTLNFGAGLSGVTVHEGQGWVCAWGRDGTIRVWDMAGGAPIGPPMRHDASLSGKTLRRWDGEAGAPAYRLDPSGTRLLSWAADGTVRLWDPRTGLQVAPAMSHRYRALGAVFTPDDRHVLTWGAEGNVRLWSVAPRPARPATRLLTVSFGSGEKPRGANLACNEDPSSLLTWSDDGTVTVWDLTRNEPVHKPARLPEATTRVMAPRPEGADDDEGRVRVAFDRQGTRVVIYGGPEPGTTTLWDTATGRAVTTLEKTGHVTFNREGTVFAAWDETGPLTLYRSDNGRPLGPAGNLMEEKKRRSRRGITDVVVNASNDRIAVVSPSDDPDRDPGVRVWDPNRRRYLGPRVELVSGVRFNPRGDRLVCWKKILAGEGHRVRPYAVLVDATSGTVLVDDKNRMRIEEWDPNALFDSSGTLLLCLDKADTSLWNALTGKPVREEAWWGMFDETRSKALIVDRSGNAELIAGASGSPTGVVLRYGEDLMVAHRDGPYVLTVGKKFLKLWELETGRPLGKVMPLEDGEDVSGFHVTPGNVRLITWNRLDGEVRLRDPGTGLQIGALMRHATYFYGAALDERSGLILTWDLNAVRLWDDVACEPLDLNLTGEDDLVEGAFFVPGRLGVVLWGKRGGTEWDFSGALQVAPETLRLRVSALTGTEYDVNSRQIRALPTDVWKDRVTRYAASGAEGDEKTGASP